MELNKNFLEKNVEVCALLDEYGSLLTKNQQNIMAGYYFENLSLGEIAANRNLTRQAVLDTIKKAESKLFSFEKVLKVIKNKQNLQKNLDKAIKSNNLTEIKNILKNIRGNI